MAEENKRGLSTLSNGAFLCVLALPFVMLAGIGFLIGPPKQQIAARPTRPSIARPSNPIDATSEPDEPVELGEPAESLLAIEFNEAEIRQTGLLGDDRAESSFAESAPVGGLLVGMRVVFESNRSDQIVGLQPIYQVAAKYELGQSVGNEQGHVTQVLAKSGYAVGQIEGLDGFNVDGFRLRFCRLDANNLKADDSYNSPWLGQQRGGHRYLGNGANFVVGVFGAADDRRVNSLGLRQIDLFVRSLVKADVTLPTWPLEGSPTPLAAINRNEAETFHDMAPDGAVLVGMRVSEGKTFGKSVQAFQPIYQIADAYRLGKWCGKPTDNEKVLLAKPGYVVSRIIPRAGLVIDALQLEFSKAENGQLAPTGAYTSDWVGGQGGQKLDPLPKPALIVGIAGSSKESLESLEYYGVATKGELWDPAAETIAKPDLGSAEVPAVPAESPAAATKDDREEKETKPAEPVRAWTSSNGKNTIEARLLSMSQGQVVIETPQGRQIKVPLEKLSAADQKYVDDWRKRRLLGR